MPENFKDFREVFLEAQQRIQEQKRRAEQALEGVPFETPRFSAEAVNRVILIRQGIRKVTGSLEFPAALEEARKLLDSLEWKARFTTGAVGEPDPERDSLYYLTPENISLRIKLANVVTRSIHEVIRSCKEVTTFEDDKNNIFLDPAIGLTVQEYVSPKFLEIQNGDRVQEPFESSIRIYKQDSRITHVQNVPGGLVHTGHKVNKIL